VINSLIQIGDVIELKDKFSGHGKFAIVIDIHKGELNQDEWDEFGYLIMTEKEEMIYISECCVDTIHTVVN